MTLRPWGALLTMGTAAEQQCHSWQMSPQVAQDVRQKSAARPTQTAAAHLGGGGGGEGGGGGLGHAKPTFVKFVVTVMFGRKGCGPQRMLL